MVKLKEDEVKKQEEEEVSKLRNDLAKVKEELIIEKKSRKKKERTVVRIAKQFTKILEDVQEKDDEIKKLTTAQLNASHENEIRELKNQLEELDKTHESAALNHHKEVTQHIFKYRNLCRDADAKIKNLRINHTKRCDEYREDIFQKTIENNRMQAQISNSKEVLNVESTDLKTKDTDQKEFVNSNLLLNFKKLLFKNSSSILIIFILFSVFLKFYLIPLSSLCSPLAPGTKITSYTIEELSTWWSPKLWKRKALEIVPIFPGTRIISFPTQDLLYEAPWWAPKQWKEKAFETVCPNSIATQVQFSHDKMVIKQLQPKKMLVFPMKNVQSATIHAQYIQVTNNEGMIKTVKAPWHAV